MEVEVKNFFEDFREDFREDFTEYFDLICARYEFNLDRNDTKSIALNLLDNIFVEDFRAPAFPKDVILEMKKNRANIGFLINRSLLYLYKKYILFMKKQDKTSLILVENLLQRINSFSNFLENSVEDKIEEYNLKVGFGNQNQIYSSNNIINIFTKMQKDGRKVRFMNLYQGTHISHEGEIVSVNDESIVFKIENELQVIAMKLEGKAYMIKDKYLDRYIKADISHSNFSDKTIVLDNFVYLLNLPAVQRKYIRIYPNILIKVTLENRKNIELKGNLYDLSIGGLGIISNENQGFYAGASVDIKFNLILQNKEYEIHIKGKILNIIEYMSSYRYCLKMNTNEKNSKEIKKYIKLREKEILEELKSELSQLSDYTL
jgi:hypothetical protein